LLIANTRNWRPLAIRFQRSDKTYIHTLVDFLPGMKKKEIFDLLKSPDFIERLDPLKDVPLHKTLNHLFSALCGEDEEVKWHAVTAMGILVAPLAGTDLERARNILRRMLWSLNEESGGIGWGIPEALGEVLARDENLAREFAPILVSYIRPGDNFLEFESLQRGALWAVGRVGRTFPGLLRSLEAGDSLLPFLESKDSEVRGLAAWGLGPLGDGKSLPRLARLRHDEEVIQLYLDGRLGHSRIGRLAEEAVEGVRKRLDSEPPHEMGQGIRGNPG
jgi:HEAT repeat protein